MSAHQRTYTSLVGSDFNDEFDQRRADFLAAQERDGIKPSTRHSRSSHLKTIKKIYDSQLAPGELPSSFDQALKKLLKDKRYTPHTFQKTFLKGMCGKSLLHTWCSGAITPSVQSLPLLRKIEHLLEVEAGTLTSRLPRKLKGTGKRKTRQTSYGDKMAVARAKPYGLWPDEVKEEWAELVAYKTSAILQEDVSQAASGWSESISSKGVQVPTANMSKSNLRLFFGYCCLPGGNADPYLRGRGMKPEAMTLALLANKEIVEGYIEFRRIRAGGKHNNGSINFLNMVTGLLRPETGFLYLHPHIAQRLNKLITKSTWHEECASNRKRLLNVSAQLKRRKKKAEHKHFAKGREPQEPIKEILSLPRPLHAILNMINEMLRDMPTANSSPVTRAMHFRNVLFIALLSANPLRIRQFAIMEFDRHLVRHKDCSWWLQLQRTEFKNRDSLNSDYCVRVAENIWPLIERYRKEFRPLLVGADSCNYVFRPSARRRRKCDDKAPMSENTLSALCAQLTYLYLADCPGTGPHGFRHIVATDIIKANPKIGFFLASKALHDKLDTVEKEYAHLKTSELFEPYNEHYSEACRAVVTEWGEEDNK
jgi:integrase